jgi:hypothetical protein
MKVVVTSNEAALSYDIREEGAVMQYQEWNETQLNQNDMSNEDMRSAVANKS